MKKILAGGAILIAITLLITGAYLRFSSLESKSTSKTQKSAPDSAPVSISASGIFIIPPGGKEISRDTAGHRFFPSNVGEIVEIYTINPKNPAHLFFLNKSGSKIEIDPGLTQIRIIDLGQKPYIRFANYGREPATIRVSRH